MSATTVRFKKSSLCADASCVEVAQQGGLILVKGQAGVLHYTLAEWKAFIGGVKQGKFDFGAVTGAAE